MKTISKKRFTRNDKKERDRMNNLSLMGRLTADPELKQTPNGVSVCSFCVAVKRPHTQDKTDFINCVAWRQNAEFICKYFNKGKMISLVAYMTSRPYEDQNGVKRTAYEAIVQEADFCGDKKQEDLPVPQNNSPAPEYRELDEDEDLPF